MSRKRVLRGGLVVAAVLAIGVAGGRFITGEERERIDTPKKTEGTAPHGRAVQAADGKTSERMGTSRVIKVTIYPDSALVTREVDVPAGTGTMELVVSALPPQIVNTSLYSEGGDGIRVLMTRFRSQPVKEDVREDVRKADEELKKLKAAAEKLQAEMDCIKLNMAMLLKLENFTEATTKTATDKATLNGETVITLAKYVMDQRGDKSKEMVALQQQLETNKEQAEYVDRQLKNLRAGSSKMERDAVIALHKTHAAAGKVRLNYLVSSCSWQPQYKLRAGKDKEEVLVEYLAAVCQQTGEEWNQVDLTLSTAQPLINAAPPELKMLEIRTVARSAVPNQVPMGKGEGPFTRQPQADLEKQAAGLRKMAQQQLIDNKPKDASRYINDAAASEQNRELMQSREEILANKDRRAGQDANSGPSVTYHLKNKMTVPSRRDEQVLEVAKIGMAPEYYYKAVPVLNKHVYRLANLTNKSEYVLLPGEGTMYQGTDFVGRMSLPLVAIGEQFTAGFGVDPQLQIQRQMLDKDRTTQGGNQVLKFEYRILVSSYKSEPVKLQVWDRLPHAEKETAGVNLVKSTPEISKDAMYVREDKPNNLLRWDLEVKPTMNGENALAINYEFKMELDRQMLISNFATK
jgi:uncharacterized protein (TIGR02231 family)